jgi:hypothetical protein
MSRIVVEFIIEKNKELISDSDILNGELERLHQKVAMIEDRNQGLTQDNLRL